MGKITCGECNKSCKGQAVRLQDRYFHVKCFKCKECKKQLSTGGFYTKDDKFYCAEDYQRLYGTKCHSCGKYVEGEVVTALGNTYHQDCFHCTKCGNKFGPGDKVTFNGKEYACNKCVDQLASPRSPTKSGPAANGSPMHLQPKQNAVTQKAGAPVTSTPAKPQQVHINANLSSPVSDMSESDKRSPAGQFYNGPLSPISISSAEDSMRHDTSGSERFNRSGSSGEIFDDEMLHPPHSQRGRLSPIQQILQYRSPSPVDSTVSRSSRRSRDSSGSADRKSRDQEYGRFYNQCYMAKVPDDPKKQFKKGPSINPQSTAKSPHFHRPENFSYTHVRRDYMRVPKKENSSMLSALGDPDLVRKKAFDPTEPVMKNEEVIKMSHYPDAHVSEGLMPIERPDWPAPPASAAIYPELWREHALGKGKAEEEKEVEVPLEPRIQKEIDEIKKIEGQSGVGRILLKELEKNRHASPVLDPRSASRTPSAKVEPRYKTRYESPVFASPSRDLDYTERERPRLHSMDDQYLGTEKYRTLPMANFPVPKPGYGLATGKSATLPDSARNGGGYFDGYDGQDNGQEYAGGDRRRASHEAVEHRSHHTSNSSIDEYDPETGLRRSRFRASALSGSNFHTASYLAFRRSMPSMFKPDDPPTIYPYDQLKVTNFQLPPGCDRNSLERHLSRDEFESIFHMNRAQFYRLAEWKQNDMKKRVGLY